MDAPASFWTFAQRFHQDVLFFVEPSESALADYLTNGLGTVERKELSDFLDRVLPMPDAGAQLMRLWQKSRADFGFERENEIAAFFAGIRQRL